MTDASGTVLLYSIHRSEAWFRHIGQQLGFANSAVVSDLRGEGDFDVVDSFYAAYRRWYSEPDMPSPHFDDDQLNDVIARCRVLRWLPRAKARAMVFGWAEVFHVVLEQVKPTAMLCWSIDCYVSDILGRMVEALGGKVFELSGSPIPDALILMRRGTLLTREIPIDPVALDTNIHTLTDTLFAPSYAVRTAPYTRLRWWRTFGYFKLRGLVFRAMSIIKRDSLNLHYVDAQSFLGHKPHCSDVCVLGMFDDDWQTRIEAFPETRRLFLPLQLFPEASIDYWIHDLKLIEHEDLVVEIATVFSIAGFVVVVKDHPLQFGFRQKGLIDRLKALPNVVFVPYAISGNALLEQCSAVFTCTGTLGMQAALIGKIAITTPAYFATPEDFVLLESRDGVADLPQRVAETPPLAGAALTERQGRIVGRLMKGSFYCDYFSYRTFNASKGAVTADSDKLAMVVGGAMREVS